MDLRGTTDDICSIMANPLLQAGVYTVEGGIANPADWEATTTRGVNNAMSLCTQQQQAADMIAHGINPNVGATNVTVVAPAWYENWKVLSVIGVAAVGIVVLAKSRG